MIEDSFEIQQRKGVAQILSNQEVLHEQIEKITDCLKQPDTRRYVYGIQGIADLFHCSRPTAQRIKSSGAIDGAISQYNRTIIVDAELAVSLLRSSRQYGSRANKS